MINLSKQYLSHMWSTIKWGGGYNCSICLITTFLGPMRSTPGGGGVVLEYIHLSVWLTLGRE